MKYMVMECHPSYAVVLGEDGRFLKVANMRYEAGQTLTEIVEMQEPQAQPAAKTGRRWIYGLAAMAACLVLAVTSVFYLGQTPYASVYMRINPEVRIDVNRSDIVLVVAGQNEDGEQLIKDYTYKKKPLDTVMDELVDRAVEMGYLSAGGQITLTLDAEDDEWVVSTGSTLSTHLNEHLTDTFSVTIQIDTPNASSASHVATIPVKPDSGAADSSYGESDYGEFPSSDDDDGDVAADSDDTDYGVNNDGVTDYDAADNGDDDGGLTDYGIPDDDGRTDYTSPPDNNDDDDSSTDYGANSDGVTDYGGGNTDYGADNDGVTNYGDNDGGDDDD